MKCLLLITLLSGCAQHSWIHSNGASQKSAHYYVDKTECIKTAYNALPVPSTLQMADNSSDVYKNAVVAYNTIVKNIYHNRRYYIRGCLKLRGWQYMKAWQ